MINAEDGDIFSWNPEEMANKPDTGDPYRFLMPMPLYIKREMFRSIYDVSYGYSLSDVFQVPKQIKWAAGIIKLGMQLPLEDIGMLTQAFKLYTDVLFTVNSVYSKRDGEDDAPGLYGGNGSMDDDTLDLLLKPCILFNPRLFFANELPSRVLTDRTHKQTIEAYESYLASPQHGINNEIFEVRERSTPSCHKQSTDTPTHLSEGNSTDTSAIDKPSGKMGTGLASPLQHLERVTVAIAGARAADDPAQVSTAGADQRAVRISRAVKLWDEYADLLQSVLQVYSTLIRGLRPLVSSEVLIAIFNSLMVVADMILSQGGRNPRLQPWADKYRYTIGPDIWDRTWATIGDRLENFVIKLIFDIWSQVVTFPELDKKPLLSVLQYWLHRDKFMCAWLKMVDQISLRALQAHYPYDNIYRTDKVHVRFGDFSMTGRLSDKNAIALLARYAMTKVDFDTLSEYGYCIYAEQICNIVNRALDVKKLIYVKGMPFSQQPPTANYILHHFKNPLFEISQHKAGPSKNLVTAKEKVFSLLCRLLIVPENPIDPITESNKNALIGTIYQTIADEHQVQIVLPSMTTLLKNSLYMRPFIPTLFALICKILPECCETPLAFDKKQLRRFALEALSTMVAFVRYYHGLGKSELLAAMSEKMSNRLFSLLAADSRDSRLSIIDRKRIKRLVQEIELCPFRDDALADNIFAANIQAIYQLLLCSVVTENDTGNLQLLTSTIQTFLHQYCRYNPGYLLIFTRLYTERLQKTQSYEAADIYVCGLTQLSFVTWNYKLEPECCSAIISSIIGATANCDKDLEKHFRWSPYHQMFISSLHCLSIWTSLSSVRSLIKANLIKKMMLLLSRCNRFIRSTRPEFSRTDMQLGRRVHLTTSTLDDDMAYSTGAHTGYPEFQRPSRSRDYITSVNADCSLGGPLKIKPPIKNDDNKLQKTHTLSNTLYKALSTAISVFSTVFLRNVDSEQLCFSLTPIDMILARMALNQNMVPDNKLLLRSCSPSIAKMLEGYTPVSIEFYSAYKRSIYSKINLKRRVNGTWSDVAFLTTGRYPSGSKQWVSFPSMPVSEMAITKIAKTEMGNLGAVDSGTDSFSSDSTDNGAVANSNSNSNACNSTLPWVRMTSAPLFCSRPRSGFLVNEKSMFSEKSVKPLVDNDSELMIEQHIAQDFRVQHGIRNRPEIKFEPVYPAEQLPRGNCFSRVNLKYVSSDVTAMLITEEMLLELDRMDELTRPFTAQTGVIYLSSRESLYINRRYAKGPLLGVSPAFKQFLETLGQSHSTPLTRLKRHPDDPTVTKYTFSVDCFEVGYNMAPNISSLLSNVPMGARNNKVFYEAMQNRGITVIWFDKHSGNLDENLAWDFLNDLDGVPSSPAKDIDKNKLKPSRTNGKARTEEPKTQVGAKTQSTASKLFRAESAHSDIDIGHSRESTRSSSRGSTRADESRHTAPHRYRTRGFFERAMHISHKQQLDSSSSNIGSPFLRSASEPRGDKEAARTIEAVSDEYNLHESDSSSRIVGGVVIGQEERAQGKQPLPGLPYQSESLRTLSQYTADGEEFHKVDATAGYEHTAFKDQQQHHHRTDTDDGKKGYTAPKIRVFIALAPIENAGGRLLKIRISATGASKELNRKFVEMTGPLASSMTVNIDDITYLLSATVINAAANIASLNCDDFSAVEKRMDMIKNIISNYSSRIDSISSLHKLIFPAGKHGVGSAFKIPQSVKKMPISKKGMEANLI
ncbi:hypothetical protein GGI25_000764 [Coemansia spiralis]|uniref:Rap-GAP domain-containing protein n=2 Tax=Coemansia TaxID=4863 RepID=A0A9W8G7Q1_9FUNG|nr:hypothetical protein EDC05_000718 [Coemansia umbellata]KAJ2621947.1 hypothetical protein GGI26_003651 [Coemansia sp. RSA 1358]KAJ2680472.1 hypothetical protein GGI25_000764 [Coemansia spiralis]